MPLATLHNQTQDLPDCMLRKEPPSRTAGRELLVASCSAQSEAVKPAAGLAGTAGRWEGAARAGAGRRGGLVREECEEGGEELERGPGRWRGGGGGKGVGWGRGSKTARAQRKLRVLACAGRRRRRLSKHRT
jgi:hypothetical protein